MPWEIIGGLERGDSDCAVVAAGERDPGKKCAVLEARAPHWSGLTKN